MTTEWELPEVPALRPGLRGVRREAGVLQVGIDPPLRVLLPDVPEIHDLLADLAAGRRPRRLDDAGRRALLDLVTAGAVVDASEAASRRAARAAGRVGLRLGDDCPSDTRPALTALLAGLDCVAPRQGEAGVVVVLAGAPMSRSRLDDLVRDRVPHLLVDAGSDGVEVGPFCLAGATACIRCVDARLGEADPRRAVVWEQLARGDGGASVDPALWAMALAWAARDVATFLEGGRPLTWSATARLTATAAPQVTTWLRHPHCGCAWADGLVG